MPRGLWLDDSLLAEQVTRSSSGSLFLRRFSTRVSSSCDVGAATINASGLRYQMSDGAKKG
jgi:hypothetical protein